MWTLLWRGRVPIQPFTTQFLLEPIGKETTHQYTNNPENVNITLNSKGILGV
jgi:hypothetical protein